MHYSFGIKGRGHALVVFVAGLLFLSVIELLFNRKLINGFLSLPLENLELKPQVPSGSERGKGSSDTEVPVESTIQCNQINCMLKDACIEYKPNYPAPVFKNRAIPFLIRVFGNASNVKSIQEKIRPIFGYCETITFALAGMEGIGEKKMVLTKNLTAALANRFVSGNCGHDLGDEAVAVHQLMQLFPDPPSRLAHLYFNARPHVCDKVLAPLAEDMYISRDMSNDTVTCYSRIYVGLRSISYMADHGTWPERMATLEDDMKSFRSLYYQYAGVSSSYRAEDADSFLIMEKRKGTHLSNIGNR